MNKLLWLALAGLGVYVIYKGITSAPKGPALKKPLVDGTVLTGRTQTTQNSRAPNYPAEVVSYGVRNWAEIQGEDGQTDWVETETA